MGHGNFTEDFTLDAIKQITDRGHSVADFSVADNVSSHNPRVRQQKCGCLLRAKVPSITYAFIASGQHRGKSGGKTTA
jgi:hypothetical protein